MKNFDIPVFVINMADSKSRMQRVKEQLDNLHLPYTRIEAVIGRELNNQQISDCYDAQLNKKLHHRDLTIGEIGCYQSHRKIFDKMVKDNISKALIIEDDIVINPILTECISLAQRGEGWDVIKIADDEGVKPALTKSLSANIELVSYNRVPNRTMGYFISLSAAKKMLKREKIYRPVDVDFQCYADLGISICGFVPNAIEVCPQFGNDENSDISRQNRGAHSNHSTFLRNLKYRWAMHQRRKNTSYDIDNFKLLD